MAMHSYPAAFLVAFLMVIGGLVYPVSGAQAPLGLQVPGISPGSHVGGEISSSGSVTTIPEALPPSSLKPLGVVNPAQPMNVTITLASSNPTGLQNSINAQGNTASPDFGRVLSPSDYTTSYGPNPAMTKELLSYLNTFGLVTTSAGNDILVDGTTLGIEHAFGVTLLKYEFNGRLVWAPASDLSLPASFGPVVSSVFGINTFVRPVTNIASPTIIPLSPRPHASITVTLTPPSFSYTSSGTTVITPITGVPVTYTASATLPTGGTCAPCLFRWTFGDGTSLSLNTTSPSQSVNHTYTQAFNQFTLSGNPQTVLVNVTDTQGDSGEAVDQVVPTMSATWMQRAYGEDQLFANGFEGQGMTIGLDEECDPSFDSGTSNYVSAVDTFSAAEGLPSPVFSFIGPGVSCSSTSGISGWSEEAVLDMDWSHAMAPDATIQVYFGASSTGSDIAGGDSTWANSSAGVFLASNSWGASEPEWMSALPGPFDSTWAQAASQGVTLFSSSGDCGATSNNTPSGSTAYVSQGLNVSYPASNPNGVGVGGTIVQTDHGGNWTNEYVWNSTAYSPSSPCDNTWGTGGGWSDFYTQPTYQLNMSGPGWAPPAKNWPITNPRGVPDVAMDAATWVDIYYPGYGWVPTGGTSLASPMFTATMSVVLQAMNRHYNSTPAGFLNYPIYTIGKTAAYATSFHDITSGDNRDPVGYSANTGWDPCTGWGSPDAYGLLGGLRTALPLTFEVSGYVSDVSTGAGISGATVSAGPGIPAATTAANGSYQLFLTNGTYTLTASATGYNPNTLAVVVNGAILKDQNISLSSISQYGTAQNVTGILETQLHVPLPGGLITATGAVTHASASTGAGGLFKMFLLNGSYTFTGSINIPDPVINPTFNSTTLTVTVSGPTHVTIILDYDLHTITGLVLDSVTDRPLAGAFVSGFDFVLSNATTDAAGNFYLHLPTGPATLNIGKSDYLPTTAGVFVDLNNSATVTIYMVHSAVKPSLVLLSLHVVAPIGAHGLPQIAGNSSATVDIYAYNSTTDAPMAGVGVELSATLGGHFSQNALVIPASGSTSVTYTTPFTTASGLDELVVSVYTAGLEGNNASYAWVTASTAKCGVSCYFPIQGLVIAQSGAPLAGLTVNLLNSIGDVITTNTSTATGTFQFLEQNGTYAVSASKTGYVTNSLSFTVKGAVVVLSPLVLNPVKKSPQSGVTESNPYILIGTAIGVIVLVAVLFLFMDKLRRGTKPKSEEGEEKTPTPSEPEPPAMPIDALAEQIPGDQGSAAIPPADLPSLPPVSDSPPPPPMEGQTPPPPPTG